MTKSELLAQINSNFPDNNNQEISALKLRQVLSNVLNESYLPGSEGVNINYREDIIYALNELCIYSGALYICIAPTTGAFDITKWERVGTNSNLFRLLSDAPQVGYIGQAGKLIGVNSAETGLEFVDGLNNASLYSFENDFLIGQGLPTIFNGSGSTSQYVTEATSSVVNGAGVYRLQANVANASPLIGYFGTGATPVTPFLRNQILEHKQIVRFAINQEWSSTNQARIVFAFAHTSGWQFINGFQTIGNTATLLLIEPDTSSGTTSHYTISLIQRNVSQTRITATQKININTPYTIQLNWSPSGCQAFVNAEDWFGGFITNNNNAGNVQCGVWFGSSRIASSTVSGNFLVDVDFIKVKGKLRPRGVNFI